MQRSGRFMIYGSTGKTGRLTAKLARASGYQPVLAGRNRERVEQLAAELELQSRVIALGNVEGLRQQLADIDIVVNMAGPFSVTAQPLVSAALSSGTHYLDVSGELAVFRALHAVDERARATGIMLMPGIGFVVVPSDCLAAHMLERQPRARYLRIGVSRPQSISKGSAETMVELVHENVTICQAGELRHVPVGGLVHMFDFGDGPRLSTAVSLPDVFTAYHTTGIPNIETYAEATLLERSVYQAGAIFGSALKSAPLQTMLKQQAQALAPASGDRDAKGRVIVAEVEDPWRGVLRTRLRTPESYEFTAHTALSIVARILNGDHQPGFQTPGRVYGPQLAFELDGVKVEDLPT